MYVAVDDVTASLWEWEGSRLPDTEWSREDIELIVERVNRGALVLDEEKPGWREKVVPDKLNMNNGSFCIIGQVYGEYDEYIGVPFGMDDTPQDATYEAVDHGFMVGEDGAPWALLDLVWVTMLQERAERGTDGIELQLPPPQPRNRIIQILEDANALPTE